MVDSLRTVLNIHAMIEELLEEACEIADARNDEVLASLLASLTRAKPIDPRTCSKEYWPIYLSSGVPYCQFCILKHQRASYRIAAHRIRKWLRDTEQRREVRGSVFISFKNFDSRSHPFPPIPMIEGYGLWPGKVAGRTWMETFLERNTLQHHAESFEIRAKMLKREREGLECVCEGKLWPEIKIGFQKAGMA